MNSFERGKLPERAGRNVSGLIPYGIFTTGHFLLNFGHALLQATLKPL
jgi:hypothetical protein